MHFGPILTDLKLFIIRVQEKFSLKSFENYSIRHFVFLFLHFCIDLVEFDLKKLHSSTFSMSLKKIEKINLMSQINFLIYWLKDSFKSCC